MSNVAEIVSHLAVYVADDAAGAEYMDKIIGCANRWADRLVAARKGRS